MGELERLSPKAVVERKTSPKKNSEKKEGGRAPQTNTLEMVFFLGKCQKGKTLERPISKKKRDFFIEMGREVVGGKKKTCELWLGRGWKRALGEETDLRTFRRGPNGEH